ncbi:MAG TPA: hypothetical protein VK878_08085 [Candidatus Deferrimicrobiaceae bacterium]|nr:hypothetical protein [Candidatus Deferrimicrobiaceae bacterium]
MVLPPPFLQLGIQTHRAFDAVADQPKAGTSVEEASEQMGEFFRRGEVGPSDPAEPIDGYLRHDSSRCRRPHIAMAQLRPSGPRRRVATADVIGGSTDERQVSERLRDVSEMFPSSAEFLAVEPEVVRVAEHLLEDEARLLEIAEPDRHSTYQNEHMLKVPSSPTRPSEKSSDGVKQKMFVDGLTK